MLGLERALELERRLADLSATATVGEFAALFGDDIIERSLSERAIRLQSGYQLAFCAGHVKVPVTASGATDWAKVSRVKFVALETAQ